MNDLVNGRPLTALIVNQYVLLNLQLELDIHVNNQNTTDHSTSCHPFIEGYEMREVKNLADTLRGTIKQLKDSTAAAQAQFASEVAHTQSNIAKLNSFTNELAQGNKDVEALLADTGTNFPDVTEVAGTTSEPKVDRNGVTVNRGK
jgi:uncharacterized phage infection (PIP) family protein YhgE